MNKNKIAEALCKANIIKFGTFTLVSGKKSPIYVDVRVLPSYLESMKIISEELSKIVKSLNINKIAGAETAGIPLATAISLNTNIPMIYVRKEPKCHGTNSMVEDILNNNDKVVIVDDMITEGLSKMKFVNGIRQANALVDNIVVVLDREQGGSEALSKEKVKLHSLITLREMLEYMRKNNLVDDEKYKEVIEYLNKK